MSVVEKAMSKLRLATPETPASAPIVTPMPAPVAVEARRILPGVAAQLEAAGLLPEPGEARRLDDQYRRIKRPILDRVQSLSAAHADGAQLVMVASALPGDGKTFMSVNLAMSIARELDVSVLLVDADVAKPNISRALAVEQDPGLLDALADDSLDVNSCILHTDIPGLAILPAGQRREAATELLSSAHMAAVAARLSKQDPARVILLDTPPLLLSSESRAIAQIVGQVVLVVSAGETPKGAVLEAIKHLDAGHLTGLVLNQRETKSSDKHYGYGVYGGDGDAISS